MLSLFVFLWSASFATDLADFPMVECKYHVQGEAWDVTDSLYIVLRPDWAPQGVDRFLELVDDEYFENTALFRAVEDFIVQFGLSASTELRNKWRMKQITDDPTRDVPFVKGIVSFAGSRDDSRETQVFITLGEYISFLGEQPWETPIGKVVIGMDKFKDNLYYGYGEMPPHGNGPYQEIIWSLGYDYLKEQYPKLSKFDTCRRVTLDTESKRKLLEENGVSEPLVNMQLSKLEHEQAPIDILFRNPTYLDVKVFWVDNAGQEMLSFELAKERQTSINSFVGHKFKVRWGPANDLVASFTVAPSEGTQQTFEITTDKFLKAEL